MPEHLSEVPLEVTDELVEELWNAKRRDDIRRALARHFPRAYSAGPRLQDPEPGWWVRLARSGRRS